MYKSYYLFQTKDKNKQIKVFTEPDEQPFDILQRFKIFEDVKFLGIYDVKTNHFLYKEIKSIEE